jgi:hypothetical protein
MFLTGRTAYRVTVFNLARAEHLQRIRDGLDLH